MFKLLSLLALAIVTAPLLAQDGFTPLFDGKSLDGWEQHGGKAKYSVEDGTIVGRSVPNTPNSFLCTKKQYGDFILEVEFKVDPRLHSGIQIRSEVFSEAKELELEGKKKSVPADRVHGYQVEIDPSDRSFSGAIYDEARRGRFLADLANNEAARKAFKQNELNKFRIECKGNTIKTWINDVPAVEVKDDMTKKGHICLQVHGVRMREEPLEVRWRNIRIKELSF
jgi:Domain of Unknown Function (DUF1080)